MTHTWTVLLHILAHFTTKLRLRRIARLEEHVTGHEFHRVSARRQTRQKPPYQHVGYDAIRSEGVRETGVVVRQEIAASFSLQRRFDWLAHGKRCRYAVRNRCGDRLGCGPQAGKNTGCCRKHQDKFILYVKSKWRILPNLDYRIQACQSLLGILFYFDANLTEFTYLFGVRRTGFPFYHHIMDRLLNVVYSHTVVLTVTNGSNRTSMVAVIVPTRHVYVPWSVTWNKRWA